MSECDVVMLDGDEEEYNASDKDVDKEDEELYQYILDDYVL